MTLKTPAGLLPVSIPKPWYHCGGDHAGFTLLELIVYLSVFSVLVAVGYATFFESMAHSGLLRRNAEDITKTLRAGERWRSDIREAKVVRLETKEHLQVLHLIGARGEVTYQWDNDSVYRKMENRPWTRMLANVKASAFVPDPRQTVTAWQWELELLPSHGKTGKVRPLFTFVAVPTRNSSQ